MEGSRRRPMAQRDRLFLRGFHDRSLDHFGHQDHLRLAWLVMKNHEPDEGLNLIKHGIKEYAESQRAGNRYHETVTVFWAQIVHHAIHASSGLDDFDAFLASFPFLLDRGLPLRHWTGRTLSSDSSPAGLPFHDLSPGGRFPHSIAFFITAVIE